MNTTLKPIKAVNKPAIGKKRISVATALMLIKHALPSAANNPRP
jgi:hypothetical protein